MEGLDMRDDGDDDDGEVNQVNVNPWANLFYIANLPLPTPLFFSWVGSVL